MYNPPTILSILRRRHCSTFTVATVQLQTARVFNCIAILNKGSVYIDRETATMEDIIIGNFDGMLITYEKSQDIEVVWNDGEYRYTFTGGY